MRRNFKINLDDTRKIYEKLIQTEKFEEVLKLVEKILEKQMVHFPGKCDENLRQLKEKAKFIKKN